MSATLSMKKKGVRLDLSTPTRSEEEMATFLSSRLLGQSDAVSAAVRIRSRALSILKEGNKCAGFYYLIGAPGVGKSELMKLLALYVHGDERAYVKLDGGSLAEKHQAQRLIGAPTGYKGYQEPEDVEKDKAAFEKRLEELRKTDPEKAAKTFRRDPRKLLARVNLEASRRGSKVPMILLFIDEADKMHQSVDDLLLNAIEDGVLSLSDNEEVDFRDVVIIMAGNTGSAQLVDRKGTIGFCQPSEEERQEDDKDIILSAMRERHRPEFLDRLDEVIFFRSLGKEDLRNITSLRIKEVVDRYLQVMPQGKAFTVKVLDSARDFILDEALKNKGNARRIKRMVVKHFRDQLSRLCDLAVDEESHIHLTADDLVKISHEKGGATLVFDLFEGEGSPAEGDVAPASYKPLSPVAQGHLGDTRLIEEAARKAKGEAKLLFKVEVEVEDYEQIAIEREDAVSVIREHLKLELVFIGLTMRAPWVLTFHVEASEAQSGFLKSRFQHTGRVSLLAGK